MELRETGSAASDAATRTTTFSIDTCADLSLLCLHVIPLFVLKSDHFMTSLAIETVKGAE